MSDELSDVNGDNAPSIHGPDTGLQNWSKLGRWAVPWQLVEVSNGITSETAVSEWHANEGVRNGQDTRHFRGNFSYNFAWLIGYEKAVRPISPEHLSSQPEGCSGISMPSTLGAMHLGCRQFYWITVIENGFTTTTLKTKKRSERWTASKKFMTQTSTVNLLNA